MILRGILTNSPMRERIIAACSPVFTLIVLLILLGMVVHEKESSDLDIGRYKSLIYHGILNPDGEAPARIKIEESVSIHPFPKQKVASFRRLRRNCPKPASPPPLPGKKGIGFLLRESGMPESWEKNLPRVLELDVSWNYSWDCVRIDQQPDSIEFLPMIWGAHRGVEDRIKNIVIPQYQDGLTKRLLGFNEPDLVGQADISVQQVVELWPHFENSGMPLASPSVAKGTGSWMIEFMKQTDDLCLRMEYVAIHWYGGANLQEFQTAMRSAYEMYGSKRPILLTEFAPADWTAQTPEANRWSHSRVLDFAKQALPWMEQQNWIAGYAWFPFEPSFPAGSTSALFDENGDITALGRYYASVTPENIYGDQTIEY